MNGRQISSHLERLFNAEPSIADIPQAWDSVTINGRAGCKGCWISETDDYIPEIGQGQVVRRIKCWLILPVDRCGKCQCNVWCGSEVTFPVKRPGEVYKTTGNGPVQSRYSNCVQWELELQCGPCDV